MTLAEINSLHGTSFRLLGRFAEGEFGAHELEDGEGGRFVLKWQDAGLAPATTAALRAVGYPAPRYVLAGEGWSIQEALSGAALPGWQPLEPWFVERAIELNELQAARGVEQGSWPEPLLHSVLVGEDGYMIHSTLLEHSDGARELLERCQAAVRAAELAPARDVVHWDFTTSNVLVEDREVTGVVDWDGTLTGDRLFDLAALVYYRAASPSLRGYIVERIGERGLAAYLAHFCIRQTEWSIRRHGEEAGASALAHSLGLARGF